MSKKKKIEKGIQKRPRESLDENEKVPPKKAMPSNSAKKVEENSSSDSDSDTGSSKAAKKTVTAKAAQNSSDSDSESSGSEGTKKNYPQSQKLQ
uniref:Uncharacterized protein n=1 Tax=Biomphalaria glabrata TaxID=6526 RepID=A0A2C9L8T5_BIOGL